MASDLRDERYGADLDELRRLRRFFWFVFLAYLPLGALVMVLNLFDVMFFALLWMTLFLLTGLRIGFFHCPACQKLAFQKRFWQNPFSRKCLHCGLRLR